MNSVLSKAPVNDDSQGADQSMPISKDDKIALRARLIYECELDIDPTEPIYWITFNPKPESLPNMAFQDQHLYSVNFLADYLKCCSAGCFCVEATQEGSPHYHGWYQVNETMEQQRVCYAKVMKQIAPRGFKIKKAVGCYRLNSYTSHANHLHYYKKDLFDASLDVTPNPITADTHVETHAQDFAPWFIQPGVRQSSNDIMYKASIYSELVTFYTNVS